MEVVISDLVLFENCDFTNFLLFIKETYFYRVVQLHEIFNNSKDSFGEITWQLW